MKTIENFDQLKALLGTEVAVSDWILVSQERINLFADATGDHQWIHIDIERAKTSPFGGTIAHGYLTLSLVPEMFASAIHMPHAKMGVNYGCNKVRFMNPVRAGSRVRGRFTLTGIEDIPAQPGMTGVQTVFTTTVEVEGQDKPACVAEIIGRRFQ
jgi:acyl dehydratase